LPPPATRGRPLPDLCALVFAEASTQQEAGPL